MAVEYVEQQVLALGDRTGMIVYRPKELVKGKQYPLIIFHPGIGERGAGTEESLNQLQYNGSVHALEAGARVHECIVIEVQPKNNYEHEETNEAYDWAKTNLKDNINWLKVYLTGLSLGGGGVFRYLSVTPNAHLKFAAAAPMCAGPLQYFVLDKNYSTLVNTKVPVWAFHNSGDTVVTPAQSTLLVKKKLADLKGSMNYTVTIYNRTGHTWPAYGFYGASDAATPSMASEFNTPTINMYEWFLMNEVGKPAVSPSAPVAPVIEPPKPAPAPAPTPEPTPVNKPRIPITGIWIEGDTKIPGSTVVEVFWEDKSSTVYRASSGDVMKGWFNFDNKSANFSFKNKESIYFTHKP